MADEENQSLRDHDAVAEEHEIATIPARSSVPLQSPVVSSPIVTPELQRQSQPHPTPSSHHQTPPQPKVAHAPVKKPAKVAPPPSGHSCGAIFSLAIAIALIVFGITQMFSPSLGEGKAELATVPEPTNPLDTINTFFRSVYETARTESLNDFAGPLILVEGRNVVFITPAPARQRTAFPYTPRVYETLKVVDHIVLAVEMLYVRNNELTVNGSLSDAQLRNTAQMIDMVSQVQAWLPSELDYGLTQEQLTRQYNMTRPSLQFLRNVLASGLVTGDEVNAFIADHVDNVMANVVDAARAQLTSLHSLVTSFRANLTASDWANVQVVISGPHQPRKDNEQEQYFFRLFDEDIQFDDRSPNILYAESIWDEPHLMRMLGNHLLDQTISRAFFPSDPERMQRDLLADAATTVLNEIFGPPRLQ